MRARTSSPRSFGLDDLAAWIRPFGVELAPEALDRLRRYLDALLLWNRRMPLVSQTAPDEILCKHFADSLFAASACTPGDRIVDLGSGAGFPGLPIAIARPDAHVTMIDSNRKKTSFLLEALRQTQTVNARVVEGRIERVARHAEHRAAYSLATARALNRIDEFLDLARPFLAADGRALAMKGPRYREELPSTGGDIGDYTPLSDTPYSLPDGSPRVLLVFAPKQAAGPDVSRETPDNRTGE